MAQGKPQLKFESNPCNSFRDNRCHRRTTDDGMTDEFRFHELCWHSQTELKLENLLALGVERECMYMYNMQTLYLVMTSFIRKCGKFENRTLHRMTVSSLWTQTSVVDPVHYHNWHTEFWHTDFWHTEFWYTDFWNTEFYSLVQMHSRLRTPELLPKWLMSLDVLMFSVLSLSTDRPYLRNARHKSQ